MASWNKILVGILKLYTGRTFTLCYQTYRQYCIFYGWFFKTPDNGLNNNEVVFKNKLRDQIWFYNETRLRVNTHY